MGSIKSQDGPSPPPSRPFLQAVYYEGASWQVRPSDLAGILSLAHVNCLVAVAPLPADLAAACSTRGIQVLEGERDLTSQTFRAYPPESSADIIELPSHPGFPADPVGESFALVARDVLSRAYDGGAAGVCLFNADWLIGPAGEAFRWHVNRVYQLIQPALSSIEVNSWDGVIEIPLQSRLVGGLLSSLDVHWELLDGSSVVGRGRGTTSANPPRVSLKLQALSHPDNWTGEARIRIYLHLPTQSSALEASEAPPTRDVLVVRRRAPNPTPSASDGVRSAAVNLTSAEPKSPAINTPGPVSIGAAGPEVARFELPLRIVEAVEWTLSAIPTAARVGVDGIVTAKITNRLPRELEAEIRISLQRAGGRSAHLATRSVSLGAGAVSAVDVPVPADDLTLGTNFVLGAVKSPSGISLKAAVLERIDGSRRMIRYVNTIKSRTVFWRSVDRRLDVHPLMRIELEGGEECIMPDPPGRGLGDPPRLSVEGAAQEAARLQAAATGLLEGIAASDPDAPAQPPDRVESRYAENGFAVIDAFWNGGEGVPELSLRGCAYPDGLLRLIVIVPSGRRAVLRFALPTAWHSVDWQRRRLWDTYPRNHPDAPQGSLTGNVSLTNVERLVVYGPDDGLALLTGGERVAATFSEGALEIPIRAMDLEIGLYPVAVPGDASGLWLWQPDHVTAQRMDVE